MPDYFAINNQNQLTQYGIPVTFTPAATNTPQTITACVVTPPLLEGQQPGTPQGVTNVFLWVVPSLITPAPKNGDYIQWNGVNYDINHVNVDLTGGATLMLKRKSN
jgi:hypothetical protein